eukprot:Sspe_Gene.96909::Locus_70445_Transcript_2_2_Confidence_0.667_Length_798::g.96909::m.96909
MGALCCSCCLYLGSAERKARLQADEDAKGWEAHRIEKEVSAKWEELRDLERRMVAEWEHHQDYVPSYVRMQNESTYMRAYIARLQQIAKTRHPSPSKAKPLE